MSCTTCHTSRWSKFISYFHHSQAPCISLWDCWQFSQLCTQHGWQLVYYVAWPLLLETHASVCKSTWLSKMGVNSCSWEFVTVHLKKSDKTETNGPVLIDKVESKIAATNCQQTAASATSCGSRHLVMRVWRQIGQNSFPYLPIIYQDTKTNLKNRRIQIFSYSWISFKGSNTSGYFSYHFYSLIFDTVTFLPSTCNKNWN